MSERRISCSPGVLDERTGTTEGGIIQGDLKSLAYWHLSWSLEHKSTEMLKAENLAFCKCRNWQLPSVNQWTSILFCFLSSTPIITKASTGMAVTQQFCEEHEVQRKVIRRFGWAWGSNFLDVWMAGKYSEKSNKSRFSLRYYKTIIFWFASFSSLGVKQTWQSSAKFV